MNTQRGRKRASRRRRDQGREKDESLRGEDFTMRSKQGKKKKKKTVRETCSARAEEKTEIKEADQPSTANRPRAPEGAFLSRKKEDKIKRSSAPSCESQENSLTATLDNDRDQRIQGYTYLMAHCCMLLAMKLPPLLMNVDSLGSSTNEGNKTGMRKSKEKTKWEESVEGGKKINMRKSTGRCQAEAEQRNQ